MRELNERDRELVAIGAAVAANCVACVQAHTSEARRAGVSDHEIDDAVRVAEGVRRAADEKARAADSKRATRSACCPSC